VHGNAVGRIGLRKQVSVTIEPMRNPDVLSPFVSRFDSRARPLKPGKRFKANACGVQNRKLAECYLWSDRSGIAVALKQTGGKIFGPRGAAELLGMKPTTLASRITALKLNRKTGL
jgi:transcriptional regulator with GAF, ATPase, and Fis domain